MRDLWDVCRDGSAYSRAGRLSGGGRAGFEDFTQELGGP